MRKETKLRSLIKTVLWRVVATLNSLTILVLCDDGASNIYKAIAMNITGFFVYYAFERVCNLIGWGFEVPRIELLLEKEE